MHKPRGLGRGLGALFQGPATTASAEPAVKGLTVMDIELERIAPNPRQPRRRFDEESLASLAQSISAHGLLAPIIVRPEPNNPSLYEIVTGERRWRAAQLAGLRSIAAIVRDTEAGEAIELAILENVQRADLNPIEEASGYRALVDEHGYTHDELAKRIGKSRPAVANAIRLLALPDAVQALVRDGTLSAGHARALLALSPGRAKQLADEAVRLGLSVRDVERKSAERTAQGRPHVVTQRPGLTPEMADAENRLRFALATKVVLHPKTRGGTVELHYTDDDDLTRILERIAPREN